jgi:hypothetical protein
VMDLLVRLATEPPDLTGLPPELAGIVRPCLERDPRKRPTSAAVLAHLAPDISLSGAGQSLASSALPGPALALIAEYRRDPKPPARDSEDPVSAPGSGDDATFGSQPAVSAPGRASAPSSRHRPPSGRAGTRRRRVYLPIWSTVAAVVLLGAGTAIGVMVAGNRQQEQLPPPPANTILVPASQASPSARQAGRPEIAMYQTFGDTHTVFVVHGEGWTPGQAVTVTLSGRVSPVHPIVDEAGTFSYAINQDHEFFRGGLPPGTYRVVVTARGARATAHFIVHAGEPTPSGGPGGSAGSSPPPGGQGPPAG